MLFNSILFLLFFSTVYVFYWNLSGIIRRNFLIFASIVFYAVWGLDQEGWWGLRWTLHFIFLVVLNYYLIHSMLRYPDYKRGILRAIVLIDLLNLGMFKYFDFLRDLILDVGVPLPPKAQEIRIFLPLAISFYTFQMVAYAVDVYRERIRRDEGISRFSFFILFFPQLIAGPIMRAEDFMEQLDHPALTKKNIYDGCWLIIAGLFKKVLLADPAGIILAPVFRAPQTYSGLSILIAGMVFSLQVYCDFSGYTDIARGTARLLGYNIPENFNAPFFARSAKELWQRWHITLATWLRDYIYIPLGGSRIGKWRTYVNLIITFTLGGLWHGADYTFVCWGAFWGFLLAGERLLETRFKIKTVSEKNPVLIVAKTALMFFLFSMGALMFRSQEVVSPDRTYSSSEIMGEIFSGMYKNTSNVVAADYEQAGGDRKMLQIGFGRNIYKLNEIGPADDLIFMFLALFLFHWVQYREGLLLRFRKYDAWLLIAAASILGGILMPSLATDAHQFIYFVF